MFGMHIRSVLSGLRAENVSTDPEMSLLLMFGVGKVCVWKVENHVFSKFGGLGGDFKKGTHEAKMIGMHIGSVMSGLEAGNVNNDREMPKYECERVHRRGQSDVFPTFGDLTGGLLYGDT